MPERICSISPAGGHLVVRLKADNALQTGAEFAIWDAAGNTPLEKWKTSAGVAGYSDHTVGTPSDQLDKAPMTWSIIVCSHDPNIVSGTVEVIVFQDGVLCPMAPAAVYQLDNVPACQAGQVIPITDELKFVGR